MWGLLLGALAAVVIHRRFRMAGFISRPEYAIAGLFLAMPHIYAFGTRTNYWSHGRSAAIFWVLVSVILIGALIRDRKSWLFIFPMVLATQAVTSILLEAGRERPYRQPQPLQLNLSAVELGPESSTLILSQAYVEYISEARNAAQLAGLVPGTPMIDLSGQSPGLLFSLAAESLGQAWTIGGYPGSLDLARAALALAPCEKIANAWILLEPDGPRSLSAELMAGVGAMFPDDYVAVATWTTAPGAGGYKDSRVQVLYEPSSPESILSACATQQL